MLTFFDFTQEIDFLSKFNSKNQIYQFKLEILVPVLIGISRIKCRCLLFSFFTGKSLLLADLAERFKIVFELV